MKNGGNGRFAYLCWFVMQDSVVGGVGPVAEVIYEAVFLWAAMDVGDEIVEVSVCGSLYCKGVLSRRHLVNLSGL